MQLAVPVVSAPNLDLLDLPKDANGQLDSSLYGSAYDPVGKTSYPVATSSVTFTPNYYNGEALSALQVSDDQDGQSSTPDPTTGFRYIPTTYTSNHRLWASNATVLLYPGNYSAAGGSTSSQDFYLVQQAFGTVTGASPGDLIEYYQGDTMQPVFDVTTGALIGTPTKYLPFTLNTDTGTINFTGSGSLSFAAYTRPPAAITGLGVPNAYMVPGSLRVTAPDTVPGPNFGLPTVYTYVPTAAPSGPNQFNVAYNLSAAAPKVAQPTVTLTSAAPSPAAVTFSYLYQCNLTVSDVNADAGPTNPYIPYTISASFESRSSINVNMGIRIYRPSSSLSDLANYPSTIEVGNANL
jgi:hypothetical protein